MIKKFKRRNDDRKFYRLNERIFAASLRVLDDTGKQIGILDRIKALELAKEKKVDLVEIAPSAIPPVAKIIDFRKFLYQEEKKKREEKKKTKTSETKEIRLRPFINTHDLEVMIKRAKGFLTQGDKVRLVVRFSGRQITHPEFGEELVNKVVNILSDISKVDRQKHFEGKNLISLLSPEKNKNVQEKDQKISQ